MQTVEKYLHTEPLHLLNNNHNYLVCVLHILNAQKKLTILQTFKDDNLFYDLFFLTEVNICHHKSTDRSIVTFSQKRNV